MRTQGLCCVGGNWCGGNEHEPEHYRCGRPGVDVDGDTVSPVAPSAVLRATSATFGNRLRCQLTMSTTALPSLQRQPVVVVVVAIGHSERAMCVQCPCVCVRARWMLWSLAALTR
jgi:hypothetical protein